MDNLEGWTPVDFMIDDPEYGEVLQEIQNSIDMAAASQEENYEEVIK